MSDRRFTGEYADDGKARRLAVRDSAGHRCIRCGHPFKSGEHGKGEWSPCDGECHHAGPTRHAASHRLEDYPNAGVAFGRGVPLEAQWRILTVHHLDGDKANDAWWNTLALCQRCHLQVQTRIDPRIPYFLGHSDWFKPYAAGFYAKKYEGKDLTREEVMTRLDELLAYEFKA